MNTEDQLHLLYALPGLEMAAQTIIEQINQIRRTLGQPDWTPPSIQVVEARKKKAPVKKRVKAQPKEAVDSEPEYVEPEPVKRQLSTKGRRKLSRLMKERWAQAKAIGQHQLGGTIQ